MKQQTVNNLNEFFVMLAESEVKNHDPGFITSEIHRITSGEKITFKYNRKFIHPQLSQNEMLYIGHLLGLPFCLDLACPGCIHVLTGKRKGLVDEWEWYGSLEEALEDLTQEIVKIGE